MSTRETNYKHQTILVNINKLQQTRLLRF